MILNTPLQSFINYQGCLTIGSAWFSEDCIMLFINFFKSFVNHWKEVWFEIVWTQSIEIKNGLAKSHTFGGMVWFYFFCITWSKQMHKKNWLLFTKISFRSSLVVYSFIINYSLSLRKNNKAVLLSTNL